LSYKQLVGGSIPPRPTYERIPNCNDMVLWPRASGRSSE
jgi:hypothetical protein